jgi:UDP-GlcNAc:undecaprenyl-phosphate GlcNAc-1-phosphate transferase
LVVPILDTSLITFSRLRRRLIPFLIAGNDHVHHRLYNLGLGQRKTVLLLYLLGIIGGCLSLIIYTLPSLVAHLVFLFLILIGISLLFLFEKLPYERQEFVRGATKS